MCLARQVDLGTRESVLSDARRPIHSSIEVRQRLVQPTRSTRGSAAIAIRLRQTRVELQGARVVVNRSSQVPLLGQKITRVV